MVYIYVHLTIKKKIVLQVLNSSKVLKISALQNKWSLKFNQSYFMLRQMYLAFFEYHTVCSRLHNKLGEML